MQFRFNLEKLLSLVRIRETMKQMEVSAVIQRVNFLKNRKKSIGEGMRKALELTRGGESPEWFAFYTSKLEMDVREGHRIDALIADENVVLKRTQDELKDIVLKRKSLESLREKRYKDFKTQQSRKLQKQLDEIYQLTR